ncbi:hypothetical protein [Thalassobellus suaedae]|uniref:Tat pathway signal sequence domain protein n=1 Tax=Thalassobellus suaedae TaxID=3074124 RepID=A0ABY9XXN0_9FLAO|nr:hypothetical protein RHP51_08755 [Flavobacteriaceae bacterium HL-DH14]
MRIGTDGSYKWLGFSTVVDTNSGTVFNLKSNKKQKYNAFSLNVSVKENKNEILINTGVLQCAIPKTGNQIISSLQINEKEISSGGELVCIIQNGPEKEIGTQPEKEKFTGNISNVSVEQNGPVRAVIKIEGTHKSDTGHREWLPFIVRLYFYAGQQSVKLIHTIIYDGDQEKDFIRGLGVSFNLPLNEEIHNRHIRFSGENNGLWDEPIQPVVGRGKLIKDGTSLYPIQLKGERIPNREAFSKRQQFLLDNWASWNDFKLMQENAEGFRIQKRTNNKSVWLDAGFGKRSRGMVFAGDVSGGLALCVRNFWQSYPASLEVRDMKKDVAKIKAWLWSPDSPAMDMRPYDTIPNGHTLIASYEDAQPGHSTPKGIARTSEILLFASSNVPTYKTLNAITSLGNNPPLLTASSKYIHSVPVFGVWSLQDRSTKGKAWVENQLDNAFNYYKKEVEQRNWYGYWDYGDVMHGYDEDRHVWKYDIGGYAWDNTELMPNMWLWYNYLRTGKQDAFRMAEAMTRHTGEVDVYHMGRFNGLGSRHNVRHWGGGAKEVRIAQSALGRFYYYLTTDERTGDLMHAVVEASNTAIGNLDPVRLIMEKSQYPTHARLGPDWFALVGNWMTEWERTGNKEYRDKILVGVQNISKMPYGFFSAKDAAFGYDPKTNKLYQLNKGDIGFLHLSVLMGGPEVSFELMPILKSKEFDKLWLQFSKLYGTSNENIQKEFGVNMKLGDTGPWYARLPAYYAKTTGDKSFAKRAWNEFLGSKGSRYQINFNMTLFEGDESLEPIYEVKRVSTNTTAQWCLNAIELLELVGDDLPEDHPNIKDK